jgi:hypothetical protein
MRKILIFLSLCLLPACGKGLSQRVFGPDTNKDFVSNAAPQPGGTDWATPEFCSHYPSVCHDYKIQGY